MDYSTKISERMWNLPDKGELESEREQTFIDDIVQKTHIERELLSHLDGIQTVFDGGAGCGRFSILLARQGLQVTHFDISQAMINKARELAEKAGVLDRITFVKGALEDLSAYADRSFDLVMSFDAPISYTWPNQEQTIRELVRIAKKRIMFSVSSRLGALPYLANPLQKNQFILDKNSPDSWVQWCLNSRQQMIDDFAFREENLLKTLETGLLCDVAETKAAYDRGETPWCITYHFMPDELKQILERCGVKDVVLAGPGAFARTIPNEILVKIMNDPEQKKCFLDFCHLYDSNPYVCGMGKDNLFARGEIR
ncbi:MAG: methyltransferase domain-containing protein [Clostridia bacterium]|nr:methyltransferase domain-containing protein [Clostridia bacterium]